MNKNGLPHQQGLYDPRFEHDACGIGFVANIKGKKTNDIVHQALKVLVNLDHRGGQGADTNTGDGAGILLQIPHKFLVKECAKLGFALPEPGFYGVGMLFLSQDEDERSQCEKKLEQIIEEQGQTLLGWRTVPVAPECLGVGARSAQPFIRQVFIAPDEATRQVLAKDEAAFERNLYVIRKRAENEIRHAGLPGGEMFYFPSLSTRTIVYKGMLTPDQVKEFYLDLQDVNFESAMALVHSRFSTNTFPSWERAHPYRYIIHNGEINTRLGNCNWMVARQALCHSDRFGDDMKKVLPVIDMDGSDSGMFDNCLEFLHMAGRSLPHSAMMMIPEPWAKHESMSEDKKAFFEYHSCMMEPWDGPAAVAFTDGKVIGAVLDRNGLRPARYYVTTDDQIVMASEVGVLDIDPEKVAYKERLRPGRMLLVDLEQGRIVSDEEVKDAIVKENPYKQWVEKYMINLKDVDDATEVPETDHNNVLQHQLAFGYTFEELNKLLRPLAKDAVDPIGAMGNDAPIAVLSKEPQLLYNYFKQLFAQVTNPPIDALREDIVTSAATTIGPEKNLIDPQPDSCHQIRLESPVMSNAELAKVKEINQNGFRSATLPILYPVAEGGKGLAKALEAICNQADQEIEAGNSLLVLSDRGVSADQAAIPALLAVSCLHHHLIRQGTRLKASLILESGEPRAVHHFALLIGYGVSGVNPYMVYEVIADMINQGLLTGVTLKEAIKNYNKAVTKGVVKVLSKMGISTIQSYRGAQIFEAIGISQEVIDKYFTWTPSRIGGMGLEELAEEVRIRHEQAFPTQPGVDGTLNSGSASQWRHNGDPHIFNPKTIMLLQQACRTGDYKLFKEYAHAIREEETRHNTLRTLLKFKKNRQPIPLEEVESVESICHRFKTGAMSYGSISQEAHEALAIAMNRIGGKSNTGEGGENPSRFIPDANGDSRRSAIKQVASGRFGVTSYYLVNADEIQIKIAQGAKPGEGGQLPGRKVYPWVAECRGTTAGVGLISPPPHHDIYSIEDLAELIHDLKCANPRARINVKLVSEVGVGTIAAGVAKAKADVILISGYDGGTGASPRTSIRHAGLPWELGLAETHQTLVLNNLRDRVVVETDGKLMTGRDVVMAALLGAEEFGFATAPLVVLGCVMMRVCNLDTCPVGVATQNPELRKRFKGNPDHVVNFMHFIAAETREFMAELGFRSIDEMVGRTNVLEENKEDRPWKAQNVDLSALLYQPALPENSTRYCRQSQDHGIERSFDVKELIPLCEKALTNGEKVTASLNVRNVNRVVGTILGSEVTRKYGAQGLPEDTISLNLYGSAGQSFGAFVPRGMTLTLTGDANDYLGKGLSGGKIVVKPYAESTFAAEENIIIGNVAFYGATSGEAYIRGVAGERFGVRNSGVHAVVEGVGDHGCEYMTGGRIVVLGKTGRNFAAGMSGGIAYIWDQDDTFAKSCNQDMVLLEKLTDPKEITEVKSMIEKHAAYTESPVAKAFLNDFDQQVGKIVRVIPRDYKRMVEGIEAFIERGASREDAIMAAFEANVNDKSRVSGN